MRERSGAHAEGALHREVDDGVHEAVGHREPVAREVQEAGERRDAPRLEQLAERAREVVQRVERVQRQPTQPEQRHDRHQHLRHLQPRTLLSVSASFNEFS